MPRRRSRRCASWWTASSEASHEIRGHCGLARHRARADRALRAGAARAARHHARAGDRSRREIARFHAALAASRRDLETIRDGIAAELGEKEALIYEAHLMMVDDPELKREVEETIRRERKPVGYCVRAYMSRLATRLENVEDEYLRERRADVLDVERRLLRHLLGAGPRLLETLSEPSVIVAHDIPPSEVALFDRARVLGFVTEVGSRTSHCAIVARGRGIPAVVSARGMHAEGEGRRPGRGGRIPGRVRRQSRARERSDDPAPARPERAAAPRAGRGARPAGGHAPTAARSSWASTSSCRTRPRACCTSGADGVGLFRTEFFYLNRLELPTEEEQYGAYRARCGAHRAAARDLPHHGPGRRQGGVLPRHDARDQSVPRLARHPLRAASPRGVPHAAARALPRQRARPRAHHVPDGVERSRAAARARAVRAGARRARSRRPGVRPRRSSSAS